MPPPPLFNGGRGRRSGGGFSRPSPNARSERGRANRGKQAPPSSAARSETGEGGAAAEGARRDQPPPLQKNLNGGSRTKRPPAAAAARDRRSKGTGGAQRSRRDGRAGFCAPTAQPSASSGGKRADKAQSRRMPAPPLCRRDGLRAYRRVASRRKPRSHNERQRGAAPPRQPREPCTE